MGKVVFGELPPVSGNRGRRTSGRWPGHAEEAAQLREHPGQWGKIATVGKSHTATRIATLIKKGEASDFPKDGGTFYQASVRKNESGGSDVWARFVDHTVKDESKAAAKPKKEKPASAPVSAPDAPAVDISTPLEIHHGSVEFTAVGNA